MSVGLKERVAHLQRAVDDLSDTVARQDRELARLAARVEMLMRREAERDQAQSGGLFMGDERPPHW